MVVFCQHSHGEEFVSKSKANNLSEFNIGIGQLIAMKRNEIAIRKADIKSYELVISDCQHSEITTPNKLWSTFIQMAYEKINMSRNHIRELNRDLAVLYEGTYGVRPYTEILEEARKTRHLYDPNNKEITTKQNNFRTYCVPQEIVDGTHIYAYEDGKMVIKRVK